MEKIFKIFVDFDGTITKDDVGDSIFREFGSKEEADKIIDELLSDKISAKECWEKLCEQAGEIDEKKVSDFIYQIEIDKTFHNLVNYCNENFIELIVLSDGFDFYIDPIFSREGLTGIKYYANKLKLSGNKFQPEFPYLDPDCRSSANCKRNHIINNSSDEDYTVYIGDGNSDKYTSQFCDFIFAKDNLLKFCEKERISYFPYKNFNDVIEKLDTLRSRKNLKKRHQAELKRREVYLAE